MSGTRPSVWRAAADLLGPHRRPLALMGLVLAASSAVSLVGPVLLRSFVDRAAAGSTAGALTSVAAAYVALAIVAPVVDLVVFGFSTSLIWRIVNDFRVRLTEHVLSLPRSFHTDRSPGELTERVDGDLTAMADFAATFVLTLVRVSLLAAGAIIVVSFYDVRVGLALVVYVVVAAVGVRALRNLAIAESEEERGAYGRLFGHLEEFLAGTDDLRANGAGQWALDRHAVDAHHAFWASQHRERAAIMLWHGATGVVTGGTFVAIMASAYAVRADWITLGTAFLLFSYTSLLSGPIYGLVEQLQEIQRAAGGFGRALALLAEPAASTRRGTGELPNGAPSLEFRSVSFSYVDDETVLHDCSFEIGAGRSVGVVGRTGSGKSTLVRLVTGDLEATVGTVVLGGIPVDQLDGAALGRRVGVVTQEVHVFGGSVRENITLFDTTITDTEVLAAVATVGLDTWLDRQGGLDATVEAGGSDLSAGEAQLLGLARVLVRDPAVVILDEATARVDPGTEAALWDAMRALLDGRTALVIAHRLGTLDVVDDILVLDHGRVVEFGPRDDLLAADSTFARLRRLTAADDQEQPT